MKSKSMPVLALLIAAAGAAHAAPAQWREVGHYALGGSGGWDLMTIDAPARRLYVTRGDHVMIVDADRGTLMGDIPGLKRAHGVAIVRARHRGYASSGGDDAIVVFDLDTLKITRTIAAGKNPDAMLYDATRDRVFAFNGGSNDVTVIDPATDKSVATIPLPGKPELAVNDDAGDVYVNLEDVSKVARLDARTLSVGSVWALSDCDEPSGIALDAAHRRVFSVCQNRHMVITDARDGRHVATIPIGDAPDGAAFDPASGDALSSNSDGTLTVVHEDDKDHFTVVQSLATPERSRCIVLDAKTHRAVLATAAFDPAPPPAEPGTHPRPAMRAESFGLLVVGVGP